MAFKKDLYIQLDPKDLKKGLAAFFHADWVKTNNINEKTITRNASKHKMSNSTAESTMTIYFNPQNCPYTSLIYKDSNIKYTVPIVNEQVTIPSNVNFNDIQLYAEDVSKLYQFNGTNPIVNFGYDTTTYNTTATTTYISTSQFHPDLNHRAPHMYYPQYQINSPTHGQNPISAYADYFATERDASYDLTNARDNSKFNPTGDYEYWGFLTTDATSNEEKVIYDPYEDLVNQKQPYFRLHLSYDISTQQLSVQKYKLRFTYSPTIDVGQALTKVNDTTTTNRFKPINFFPTTVPSFIADGNPIVVTLKRPYITLVNVDPGSIAEWSPGYQMNNTEYTSFVSEGDRGIGKLSEWVSINTSSKKIEWETLLKPSCGTTWCYMIDLRKWPSVWYNSITPANGLPPNMISNQSKMDSMFFLCQFSNFRPGGSIPSTTLSARGWLKTKNIPYFTVNYGRNCIKIGKDKNTSFDSASTLNYNTDGVWEYSGDVPNLEIGFGVSNYNSGTTSKSNTWPNLYPDKFDTSGWGYSLEIPSFYKIFGHEGDFRPLVVNNPDGSGGLMPIQAFNCQSSWKDWLWGGENRYVFYLTPWIGISRYKRNIGWEADFNLPGFGDFAISANYRQIRPNNFYINDAVFGGGSCCYWYPLIHNYYFDMYCYSSAQDNYAFEYNFNYYFFQFNKSNITFPSNNNNLLVKNDAGSFGTRYAYAGLKDTQHRQRGIGIVFMNNLHSYETTYLKMEALEYPTSCAANAPDSNNFISMWYYLSPLAWYETNNGNNEYAVLSPRVLPNANSVWTGQYYSYTNNGSNNFPEKYGYPYKVEVYNGSCVAPGACGIIGPVA